MGKLDEYRQNHTAKAIFAITAITLGSMLCLSLLLFVLARSMAGAFDASLDGKPTIEAPEWLALDRSVEGAGTAVVYGTPVTRSTSTHKEALPQRLRGAYDHVETALRSMSPMSVVNCSSYGEMSDIVLAVLYDNPDIYWATNFFALPSLPGELTVCFIYNEPTFEQAKEKHAAYMAEIEDLAKSISYIDDTQVMGETFLAKRAMDVVCERLDYGHGILDQTAKPFFEGGTGVCACYAKAYQLLCSAVGLECYAVVGSVNGQSDFGHAWNISRLDGRITYIDPTWNDLGEEAGMGYMTQNGCEFLPTHSVSGSFGSSEIVLQGEEESLRWIVTAMRQKMDIV